jgi:hypothetical protein
MLYVSQAPDASVDSTSTISGRNLAHGRRSVVERAFLAADLHLDRVALITPTIKQSAILMGICAPYVAAAIAIAGDPAARDAVLAGSRSLLDAAKAGNSETLTDHFARSTPEQWVELARTVGVDAIWDGMVAPLI